MLRKTLLLLFVVALSNVQSHPALFSSRISPPISLDVALLSSNDQDIELRTSHVKDLIEKLIQIYVTFCDKLKEDVKNYVENQIENVKLLFKSIGRDFDEHIKKINDLFEDTSDKIRKCVEAYADEIQSIRDDFANSHTACYKKASTDIQQVFREIKDSCDALVSLFVTAKDVVRQCFESDNEDSGFVQCVLDKGAPLREQIVHQFAELQSLAVQGLSKVRTISANFRECSSNSLKSAKDRIKVVHDGIHNCISEENQP